MVSNLITSEEISTIIGASLGIFGALMIIIIFIYFKAYKIFYRKLVFVLSIYDLIQSISYLLPGRSNEIICRAQYFLLAIFGSTPQFWASVISIICYLKVAKQFNDTKLNKIYKWIHLSILIPMIILVAISFISHDYKKSNAYWCASTTRISLIFAYSIVWIYVITCLIFYILSINILRKMIKLVSSGYSSTKISQTNQIWIQLRMSLIPLIEMIITIPLTIKRIREIINPSVSEINSLDIISSLLFSSQGFWDFWIFIIFDPEIRSKLKNCSPSKKYQEVDLIDFQNEEELRMENNF
ncbi:g-protein coupled receptor 157-like [Anaeramoeba ignava]|uniref:G-protein coupled receptor 157-like n=1 Tax=Anaeramoeba ignava TaxID=1746090 RepID=A0A9Q0RGG1_ANAIG|nr:g-protein coupled receptor 157-like [Anaeramoeba ignava]